jgi:hypothetical protein
MMMIFDFGLILGFVGDIILCIGRIGLLGVGSDRVVVLGMEV